jgi:hypothetical protein
MATKIHTPSPYELGILAGLADRGTYDNPYEDYYEKHDHERWDEGYALGQKLLVLVATGPET